MKKIYIQPVTALLCAQPTTIMAASGAVADLDSGKNGGFTDHEIDVDNGDDESDAKYNVWDEWDD